VSAPRFRRALAASAAVHVAVLAALLALANPRFHAAPAMRVALLGQAGTAGSPDPGPASPRPSPPGLAERSPPAVDPVVSPSRPPPARASPRAARQTDAQSPAAEGGGDEGAHGAEALVSAVQSDVWVLSGSALPRGPSPEAAAGAGPAGASPGTAAASGAASADTSSPAAAAEPGAGTQDTPGGASLLAALSQRLAWSAARCAPAEVVRTARHAVPGVPLHFCLDATGRPSDVGLLGTTGSDVLDRAARDCVVPGALPLPPVPGCYTVEVRFPTRG
jgi:hypothetical protein